MGILDFFKKKQNQSLLSPGQTNGEYIGCYTFGISGERKDENSYHSLAITKEELIKDCKEFFIESLEDINHRIASPRKIPGMPEELEHLASGEMARRYKNDVELIKFIIENTEQLIETHLRSNASKPFVEVCGCSYFLGYGIRKRQKVRGEYIE